MKKKFTFLFTALFAVTSLWAQEFQSGDLKYYLDDGSNVMVTKGEYEGLTKVVIPETVEYEGVSYAVTGIWSGTFANCEKLVSITIPNSVKNIGCEAFSGCSSLASITIPNSIKNIEYALFADCSSLTSITIPESVINIEETAFARCSSLESIKVESGNIIYDSRENCNAIIETASNSLICGCKNTTIPNNVISIASGAFEDCSGLASIAIPNGVASIKGSAFRGCTSLTSIHIPCSVTDIANMAFMDCPAIELITVEEGNNVYDSRDNCNAIIKKENSFSSILELGCKNTVIPYNTTQIAGYAFFGCSGLKSITIPNSVTYIGGRAFGGCI